MMECRRCSECQGMTHHWMPNDDFGNDPDEAEDPTGNEYACKHCDAVGDECSPCEGAGEIVDEIAGICIECPSCVGEGVALALPRSHESMMSENGENRPR